MDDHCHGAYFELAFLHRALDDEELSRRSLEKAVSLRPLYPDYRYQLGVMLLDQGKFDEGIVQLERVRLLNPSYGHCSLHLASAYMEKNCPAQALDALSTPAVRDWTEALLLEAGVHIQSGDPSRATECLENVLEREPDHEEAQEILAKLEAVG